jgi:hypothetical protein
VNQPAYATWATLETKSAMASWLGTAQLLYCTICTSQSSIPNPPQSTRHRSTQHRQFYQRSRKSPDHQPHPTACVRAPPARLRRFSREALPGSPSVCERMARGASAGNLLLWACISIDRLIYCTAHGSGHPERAGLCGLRCVGGRKWLGE